MNDVGGDDVGPCARDLTILTNVGPNSSRNIRIRSATVFAWMV